MESSSTTYSVLKGLLTHKHILFVGSRQFRTAKRITADLARSLEDPLEGVGTIFSTSHEHPMCVPSPPFFFFFFVKFRVGAGRQVYFFPVGKGVIGPAEIAAPTTYRSVVWFV